MLCYLSAVVKSFQDCFIFSDPTSDEKVVLLPLLLLLINPYLFKHILFNNIYPIAKNVLRVVRTVNEPSMFDAATGELWLTSDAFLLRVLPKIRVGEFQPGHPGVGG